MTVKIKKLINSLILILKRYIYATKCKNTELSFIGYMQYIIYIRNVEALAASMSDETKTFKKKWSKFDQI